MRVDDVQPDSKQISQMSVFDEWERESHLRLFNHPNGLEPKHSSIRVSVVWHGWRIHEDFVSGLLQAPAKRLDRDFDAMQRGQIAVGEESDAHAFSSRSEDREPFSWLDGSPA
jgi:hypothetical protein